MAERCEIDGWVEVESVLLEPGERADGLPEETAACPLTMWVRGFARSAVALGERVEIETASGRLVTGTLVEVDPGYFHSFGTPPPELVRVGRDLRARVAAYRGAGDAR